MTTTTFLSQAQRQDLIEQYIDCYEETGGEFPEYITEMLESLSNPALINEINASGWDII